MGGENGVTLKFHWDIYENGEGPAITLLTRPLVLVPSWGVQFKGETQVRN